MYLNILHGYWFQHVYIPYIKKVLESIQPMASYKCYYIELTVYY